MFAIRFRGHQDFSGGRQLKEPQPQGFTIETIFRLPAETL